MKFLNFKKKETDEVIETKNAPAKIKNTVAMKKGSFATLLIVIFIVVAILLNVLATAVADRFPLDIDLTADQIHSLTAENIKYIKSIDKKVTVNILLPEEQYTDGYTLDYYAAMMYKVDNSTNSTATYYQQTVDFLKLYDELNENITVKFLDVTDPSTESLLSEYTAYNFYYGDILLRCTWDDAEGKTVYRRAVINYDDIYTLTDLTGMASMGYGGYTITANNLENELSSALYRVTSDSTPTYFVPSDYCDTYYAKVIEDKLKDNNYDVEFVDGLLSNADLSKYDGMILAAPSGELNTEELEVIDKFLDNDGKKGKNLLFFGNVKVYECPNLLEFLGEWGVGFEKGILYDDTNGAYFPSKGNTTLFLNSTYSEYTQTVDSTYPYYIATNIFPLIQEYETYDTRKSEIILTSPKTATIAPFDLTDEWTIPKDAVRDSYPVGIITYEDEIVYDEEGTASVSSSHVAVFSTANLLDETWLTYNGVGNVMMTVDLVNTISGQDGSEFSFAAKQITSEDYSEKVTKASANAVRIIFMGVIPVILIVVGVVVWIRRKNA